MSINTKMKGPLFHHNEILFCGYSNSGKTTLIGKVVQQLSREYRIGYAKHDVHRFEMDKPGKDTHQISEAGAYQIAISDNDHWATIGSGRPDLTTKRALMVDCDFVIIEGYKSIPLPKLVVIDSEKVILEQVKDGKVQNVKAFVGPWAEAPDEVPADIPYFQRDEVASISSFVRQYFEKALRQKPLAGIVLGGGRSTRMGRDKAQIQYYSKPHAAHLYDILHQFIGETYISGRKGQWTEDTFKDYPILEDRFLDMGPVGGILTAMQAKPDQPLLVVACDLPYVDEDTISYLIDSRDPHMAATCYKDANGLPEPLCAIYEPRMKFKLLASLGLGIRCPRKVLLHSETHLLKQIRNNSLANFNHQTEFDSFHRVTEGAPS